MAGNIALFLTDVWNNLPWWAWWIPVSFLLAGLICAGMIGIWGSRQHREVIICPWLFGGLKLGRPYRWTDPAVINEALATTRETKEYLEKIEGKFHLDIEAYTQDEKKWRDRAFVAPNYTPKSEAQHTADLIRASRKQLETKIMFTLHELKTTLESVKSSLENEQKKTMKTSDWD